MRFTWDPVKNEENRSKHEGIEFELAREVFLDPDLVLLEDRVVDGVQRWHAIGVVSGQLLLLVVHEADDDDEAIHIISAREAEGDEIQRYRDGH